MARAAVCRAAGHRLSWTDSSAEGGGRISILIGVPIVETSFACSVLGTGAPAARRAPRVCRSWHQPAQPPLAARHLRPATWIAADTTNWSCRYAITVTDRPV